MNNRNNQNNDSTEFGEACYELSDHPLFEKMVKLENLVKEDLTKELLEMDQTMLMSHGAMLSDIIRGIDKIHEYRQLHKQLYIDNVLNNPNKQGE